jgi:hypothetical protein
MFVRQNQQQFRNSNADVQIFYGPGQGNSDGLYDKSWNKPPGVSHVYILCIGHGGMGDAGTATGGGSGAVSVWYGAAQNVPDSLVIALPVDGSAGGSTIVGYKNTAGNLVRLVNATGGNSSAGGTVSSQGAFASSGFTQNIAGQAGSISAISASNTTFLSGGSNQGVSANYGYSIPVDKTGFFLLQPIIVGVGSSQANQGGIGCGGGAQNGFGGFGMVLIASW